MHLVHKVKRQITEQVVLDIVRLRLPGRFKNIIDKRIRLGDVFPGFVRVPEKGFQHRIDIGIELVVELRRVFSRAGLDGLVFALGYVVIELFSAVQQDAY